MSPLGRPRVYPDLRTQWRERQRRYRKAKHQHLKVYHRSLTTEWATPQPFFDALHAEFGFTLDVCATPANAKCRRFFTLADDGLQQDWVGVCWMNPPYGKTITLWMRKAAESAQGGALVVCLVPVRTDTQWWQRYVLGAEVRFVAGRLTFGGARNPAPFPNAVVISRPRALLWQRRGSAAEVSDVCATYPHPRDQHRTRLVTLTALSRQRRRRHKGVMVRVGSMQRIP